MLYESHINMEIVGIYLYLINIASTINNTIKQLLTGYNATTKKYKTWKNQPDRYCNMHMRAITKNLHYDSDIISAYDQFQTAIVEEWNPESKDAYALLIPPVSLRDEIKTDGYGMVIIEILCLQVY